MKKLVLIKRVFLSTLISAALLSMTAIAAENTPAAPMKGPEEVAAVSDEVEQTLNYQLVMGKIETIETIDGYTRMHLSNSDMGMVCNVKEDAFIISQKDGSYQKISDLKEGMEIAGILDNNSPMTLSIPPMTNGMIGFVILDDEAGNLDLAVYNEELVNHNNTLKLNIGEETKIVDQKGSKKIFTEEDLKGKECLVFYGVTTRSIPAQTTPSIVMILEEEPKENAAAPEGEPMPEKEMDFTKYTGIRQMAEEFGYTIHWTSNEAPILLEKENVKIEITVGSKICSINGIMAQMQTAPMLKDSRILATEEYKAVLQKYSGQ